MKDKTLRYLFVVLFLLNGCATTTKDQPEDTILESYNRAMFKFNNVVEKNVIRPVAKGYKKITNQYMRQRVTNFFDNIEEPVSMANHFLQGEIHASGENFARFVINTTIGGLGLYDVAEKTGLKKNATGFDATMATWGVPDGSYIILPIIGPSTPRAATGWVVDGYSSPAYWVAEKSGDGNAKEIYYGAFGLKYLNKYAENMNMLESLEEGSIDYYEAVKSAYLQNRKKLKSGSQNTTDVAPEYDFDMDVDED